MPRIVGVSACAFLCGSCTPISGNHLLREGSFDPDEVRYERSTEWYNYEVTLKISTVDLFLFDLSLTNVYLTSAVHSINVNANIQQRRGKTKQKLRGNIGR